MSKKMKKARFDITNVSIKNLSNIIKELKYLPYEGYERKSYKHMPYDSYIYLTRQISKCMMRLNVQKMNNSETSTQNIPNSHVCSLDNSEPKMTNTEKNESHVFSTEKNESKRVIVNACSSDKSESKSVHISVNTSEVKGANNETNDEETLVTDNSVINVPSYLKKLECGKNS